MATSQNTHIKSEWPFWILLRNSHLKTIYQTLTVFVLSKDCFFNPELRAEAYSTSLRHFGYHTHTACRISTPREHWVRLRMTYGNTKFHQSTEHRVNCQGEWLESTLHSSAVGRPLGQLPKKQFTCTKVAQLFAYSSHDNQEQLLICTCLLHLPGSAHGEGNIRLSAQASILSPTEHRSSRGNDPQPAGSLLPNFPGWYLLTQQEPTS